MKHIPVLLNETINILNPKKSKIYVDATFGLGGYTKAILDSSACNVIGIDCDKNTLMYADHIKQIYPQRFNFIKDNFKNIDIILKNYNISNIDGIVFDLGFSSLQIEDVSRGFSFIKDGPLDMRMDRSLSLNAMYFVNQMTERELSNLIYSFGGERKSRLIARNIIQFREKRVIQSTKQLVKAIGVKQYNDNIHFATRTFQALRIAVNSELDNLKICLGKLPALLSKDATISVVTFHSLEDKIVKDFFNNCSHDKNFRKINKKVITPNKKEIASNLRSRSAKLRGLKRI